MLSALNEAPTWLNSGDTAWQLTSATLVGIMSIPGLAILYAGLMKRKFAVNSALMVVYAFAMTLVIWMFFAYDMSFGQPAAHRRRGNDVRRHTAPGRRGE